MPNLGFQRQLAILESTGGDLCAASAQWEHEQRSGGGVLAQAMSQRLAVNGLHQHVDEIEERVQQQSSVGADRATVLSDVEALQAAVVDLDRLLDEDSSAGFVDRPARCIKRSAVSKAERLIELLQARLAVKPTAVDSAPPVAEAEPAPAKIQAADPPVAPRRSMLAGISLSDCKQSLKATQTRVRQRDGRVFVEERASLGGLTTRFVGVEATPQYVLDQEAGRSPMQPKSYCSDSDSWRGHACEQGEGEGAAAAGGGHNEGNAAAKQQQPQLTAVSFNVWFDKRNWEARAQALFRILGASRATVIALQEVTPAFLSLLRDQPWVRENYVLSDSVGTSLRGSQLVYGVLTLVLRAVAVRSVTMHSLPTNMNRSLLVVELVVAAKVWRIGNVHLESLDNSQTRRLQLDRTFEVLDAPLPDQSSTASASAPSISTGSGGGGCGGTGALVLTHSSLLLGDLNFDGNSPAAPEHASVPPEYVDAWTAVHPATAGATMPFDDVTGRPTRIDRALLRSPRGCHRCSAITRLGMEGIGIRVANRAHEIVRRQTGQQTEQTRAVSFAVTDLTRAEEDEEEEVEVDERPSDHYGLQVVLSGDDF
jgi:endonuclease/exonuclease/phosphatase family metal-dependent hydrolase